MEKKWDDKEHLVFEIKYKNKKLNGKSTFWYRSGKLKSESIYKSGKLNGEYTEYRVNETKVSKGIMKNDKMNKKWTFWYHNGKKECEVICENGKLIDGKVWDDDGNIKESIRFNYKR